MKLSSYDEREFDKIWQNLTKFLMKEIYISLAIQFMASNSYSLFLYRQTAVETVLVI